MNEGTKTAIFGGTAAVTLILALMARPDTGGSRQEETAIREGKDVFQKFQDPDTATSLQITKYDGALAQVENFEVARDADSRLWSLPSRSGYPADAAEQVRDATTPLIGLKIVRAINAPPSDHEMYGVVNPDDDKLLAGSEGVGMLVTIKDDADVVLASLVIGDQVEGTELRYVRKPEEDAVYTVELDPTVFTTNFQDWIDGELLGVRSMDINRVRVRDYKLAQTPQGWALTRNFDATASYESVAGEWGIDQFVTYDLEGAKDSELAEDEEVNRTFLNNLRTAIQDLQIVDVKRKPEGLTVDLVADESLLRDAERLSSLQDQGFLAIPSGDSTDILSVGGETIIGTEDGVEYVLRFGEATASLSSSGEGESLRRYLMVAAQVNEDNFPMPELTPVPETVEDMLAMEKAAQEAAAPPQTPPAVPPAPVAETGEADAETAPAETGSEDGTPEMKEEGSATQEEGVEPEEGSSQEAPESPEEPDTAPTKEPEPPAPEPEPPAPEPEPAASEETTEAKEAPQEEPAKEESSPEEEDEDEFLDDCGGQEGDEDQEAEGSQEDPEAQPESASVDQADATADPETPPAVTPAAPPQETEEDLKERLEALRDEIGRENQRKLETHKEQIEAAQQKVLELNARFGLWYYVVEDSVYKKLKISRDDLISKKTTPEAGAGAGLPAPPPGIGNFNPAGGFPGGAVPPQGPEPQRP